VSRGGMRDAVSLLELCAGSRKTVDERLVFETVGSGNRDSSYKLIEAILKQDYTSVYSTVNEVVMNSADISVFWQEIIDSYRDIMVVKNTDKAKSYLDLTDVEYETLKSIASEFTMARLSYHTTLLEAAIADMQRATNSKRSIAEITLTRMCDQKLVVSTEALALRVEELEKKLSMMKFGIPISSSQNTAQVHNDTVAEEVKAVQNVSEPSNEGKTLPYGSWREVVERIGEIKRSLSSQFNGAVAYKIGENEFLIKMSEFFAKRIASNESDLAIVRGVIAETENVDINKINVKIDGMKISSEEDISSELEKLMN
jgi:DNA polymerase-3 subunit gamma/tau